MTETQISEAADEKLKTVVAQAREVFNGYAAFNGDPRAEGFSKTRALQIELDRWEKNNFGLQPPWTSSLGIIEEVGELLTSIGQGDIDETIDAIGDIQVFSVNLCTKMRLDYQTIQYYCDGSIEPLSGMDIWLQLWKRLGVLAHVILKSEQKIRGYDDVEVRRRDTGIAVAQVLQAVTNLCFGNDLSTEEILHTVAEDVLKRNWNANSTDGQAVDVN